MEFKIILNNKFWHYLTVLLAAVILFFSLLWGLSNGKKQAQAMAVLNIVQQLTKGLDFFYSDQDRFPKNSDFANKSLMLNYFNSFPPPDLASTDCRASFDYNFLSQKSYQLKFCLAAPTKNFQAGVNSLTIQHD